MKIWDHYIGTALNAKVAGVVLELGEGEPAAPLGWAGVDKPA